MTEYSFDLESHLFQPGLACPPHVCGSQTSAEGPAQIMSAATTLEWYRQHVGKDLIIGANIAFDNSLMVTADGSFALLCRVFKAYEDGLFSDVQIRAMLNHIGRGWVQKHCMVDPHTAGTLMDPSKGKKAERMSLATVLYLATGRIDAKKNADWRLKYALLENVPMAEWPFEARQYPLDDVKNPLEAWQIQQREYINLGNEQAQLRAAWAMRLASVWGLRTDPVAVAAVEARVDAALAEARRIYTATGFIREDGTENTGAVAQAVAEAYGDASPCETCTGTGRVLSAKQPKRETTARRYINCKACGASGRALVNSPRTPAGGIKCDRDTLEESGNETLEKYAKVSMDEKFKGTYLPVLKRATKVPMNPEGNVLVASGRTSYDGVIQLIPRGGGLRECFVPRPGWVYFSNDYAALELCTLAQCNVWIVGWSEMAQAINAGQDLHTKFAAAMIGETYEAALKLVKSGDKKMKGYRQAAKAANFGFPGGMGAPKLVAAKRKEGLRFCITLGEAPPCGCSEPATCRRCLGRGAICGVEMIREWNGRECPPVCKLCCQLADQLRTSWFKQWPEIPHYFKYIKRFTQDGNGTLEQFVSKRLRGGLDFCNGANTLFQGLAADGAKHALWLSSKECYVVPESDCFGARPEIFVHDEIFGEAPCEIAARAAPRIAQIMKEGMTEYVPDVLITVEPTLMPRWYKQAECVRAPDGELLVWSPDKKHYRAATGEVP